MHGPSDVEVARALIVAFSEGRLAQVLDLVDRDIVWLMQTRPGPAIYIGHDGTAQLMADLLARLGAFRVVIEDGIQISEGVARLRGWRIRTADEAYAFDLVISVRDALVTRVDSRPVGNH